MTAEAELTTAGWTRPLLKWTEVFFLPLLIGVQLVLTGVLWFVPVLLGQRPPSPAQTWSLFLVNGLVEALVFG